MNTIMAVLALLSYTLTPPHALIRGTITNLPSPSARDIDDVSKCDSLNMVIRLIYSY